MATLIVRSLSEDIYKALSARAALTGRSVEAEVREILTAAVSTKGRVKLGSLLTAIGREARLSEREFEVLEQVRDKKPARQPMPP